MSNAVSHTNLPIEKYELYAIGLLAVLAFTGLLLAITYPLVAKAQEPPVLSTNVPEWPPLHIPCKTDYPFLARVIAAEFDDAPIMLDIACAESRLDPNAKNPHSTATGVFQILVGTWALYGCTGERTDALDNINCARKIYDTDGTSPWNASRHAWN